VKNVIIDRIEIIGDMFTYSQRTTWRLSLKDLLWCDYLPELHEILTLISAGSLKKLQLLQPRHYCVNESFLVI